MKKYLLYSSRNSLLYGAEKAKNIVSTTNIENYTIKNIYFENIINIKDNITQVLLYFFKKLNIANKDHIFIIGLGNENHTADSIGPKVLKHINVNSYFTKGIKVSALEPGVFGTTGIDTLKIIKSVCDEIKPDLVILIDSMVSDDVDHLNKLIQIKDCGINPESSIKGLKSKINIDTLGIPTLSIGVVSTIEIKFTEKDDINFIPYLLSTKDIDEFASNISFIIGQSLNKAIDCLSKY